MTKKILKEVMTVAGAWVAVVGGGLLAQTVWLGVNHVANEVFGSGSQARMHYSMQRDTPVAYPDKLSKTHVSRYHSGEADKSVLYSKVASYSFSSDNNKKTAPVSSEIVSPRETVSPRALKLD